MSGIGGISAGPAESSRGIERFGLTRALTLAHPSRGAGPVMTLSRVDVSLDLPAVSRRGDDSLLERLGRGEPRAVGEAYDLHHAPLRAFARRLLGDAHAAEDLVHDVFVSLPELASRFRGESTLRSFLFGIAVNRSRHHLRSAMRRRAASERLTDEPRSEPATPEQDARRAELRRALVRALDALPHDQRVAFVLCEMEELGSREVAEMVGAPEGTVRTRLMHAKKKLREAFEREGHG